VSFAGMRSIVVRVGSVVSMVSVLVVVLLLVLPARSVVCTVMLYIPSWSCVVGIRVQVLPDMLSCVSVGV